MSPKETPAKPIRKRVVSAPAVRPKAAPAGSFETTLASLGRKADEARARLGELTDEGAKNATRSLHEASRVAQAKMRKLDAQWRQLAPKKKAKLLAGVLGAIAAAVAVPLVVRQRRKARAAKSAAKTQS